MEEIDINDKKMFFFVLLWPSESYKQMCSKVHVACFYLNTTELGYALLPHTSLSKNLDSNETFRYWQRHYSPVSFVFHIWKKTHLQHLR